MTQSVRQSRRKLFQNEKKRYIRVFYALSVLQFCTNITCSAPLHILITEAVLCHGGSLELVRILNRLGAAASVETVNRLATYIVQARINTGIKPELESNRFTTYQLTILISFNLMVLCPAWMQQEAGTGPLSSVYSPFPYQASCHLMTC